MFLKVARKDLQLPNLDNNIKCGNSIIDNPDIVGDEAFNWKEEFKEDKDAIARIEKYQESYRYAMEIDEFQDTTAISLDDLRRDVPGFVANRMQHALWREAISIVEQGIADPKTVDDAVKYIDPRKE